MKALRALASEIVALQKRAQALGMFADDRELLACAKCGLHEDVTFSGFLITLRPAALDEDTGLRFKELAGGRYRCPVCGATVRDEDELVPVKTKIEKRKRSCRNEKNSRADVSEAHRGLPTAHRSTRTTGAELRGGASGAFCRE